jgi:hypothetical protein
MPLQQAVGMRRSTLLTDHIWSFAGTAILSGLCLQVRDAPNAMEVESVRNVAAREATSISTKTVLNAQSVRDVGNVNDVREVESRPYTAGLESSSAVDQRDFRTLPKWRL